MNKEYQAEYDKLILQYGISPQSSPSFIWKVIGEILISILQDFVEDGKVNWWKAIWNIGQIIGRIKVAFEFYQSLDQKEWLSE